VSARHSKVIGYFAYASPTEVVCTGDACVISGSRRAMEEYISEIDPDRRKIRTIKKTTFDEIKRGLLLGAAYAFDKTSYRRFYPLAYFPHLSNRIESETCPPDGSTETRTVAMEAIRSSPS
jgi:hypothetical protein